MMTGYKLNLGCGNSVADGWINVDYSLGARLAHVPLFSILNRRLRLFDLDWNRRITIHDLGKPFPWPAASARVVYSSHTLEHFTRDDGRRLLAECHRVLRPGGILRIVVPDLAAIIREYNSGSLPADELLERLHVSYSGKTAMKRALAPFVQFPHRCMYDESALLRVIREAGFAAATRNAFDSDIDDIRVVELESRTLHSVIVEGRKT